jgi:uncharacterized membrane protein YphA (DoxX/SURF4 family)
MKIYLGRHVYGLAAIIFGIVTLYWHDFNGWQQIRALGDVPHREILVYLAAAVELFGGVAIQVPRTARLGALALGVLYFIFALLWVPFIIKQPRIYDGWGNFFEQFSIVSGALIVYATFGRNSSERPTKAARMGYLFFAICVISFTLEQLFYLSATASFVPKWIPPGQMFWAVVTTIAFALATIALLAQRVNLLASRLLTAMIVGFQLLVWLPAPFTDPHKIINWAGNSQNLAITGAAWIVADFLAQTAPSRSPLEALPQRVPVFDPSQN